MAERVSSTGSVASTDLYDAFGQKLAGNPGFPGSPNGDPYGFGGQAGYYTDAETGLCLLTHRYYDPGTGRFLTRDPLGYGGGINLYSYTQNNPGNEMDPSGYGGEPAEGGNPFISEDLAELEELLTKAAQIREEEAEEAQSNSDSLAGLFQLQWELESPAQRAKAALEIEKAINAGGDEPENIPNGRPKYVVNNPHLYAQRKDPLPDDAEEAYERSVLDPDGRARWSKGSKNSYYRYQGDHTGWHFNGEFTAKEARSGDRCMANVTWKQLNPK